MDYTSIKVGQLPTDEISGGNFIPHEVAGVLKKATFTDLAAFIGANDAVGFRAVSVANGGTLPATTTQEFILVGPGTYNNVGGGSTITVTEELNALVSNGTYWFVGVEIPIDAPPGNAVWGQIIGTLSNQTDLQNLFNLKADLVDGKVPSSQLPSYVDDVIEVANYAALPATGETGKIYITIDTEYIYRWSGSAYIRIVDEAAAWGTITGTLSDQTDLQSALDLRVPYTGATGNVDLGSHKLTASDLVINHASGSGVAATISKGGNGEALTVTKSSGTGNVASFSGGTTLISELHLTTDLADAYIASAATWNAKQSALSGTGFVKISGTTISYDNSTYIDNTNAQTVGGVKTFSNMPILGAGSGVNGQIVYADSSNQLKTITNFKYNDSTGVITTLLGNLGSNAYTSTAYQPLLTNPITGSTLLSGNTGEGYIPRASASQEITNSLIYDTGTNIGIGTYSPSFAFGSGLHVKSNSGWGEVKIEGISGAAGALTFYSEGTALADIYADTDKNLSFRTNGASERMRILANGNVGIGTTSPAGQLDVYTSIYKRFTVSYPSTLETKLGIGLGGYIKNDDGNEKLILSANASSGSVVFNTGSSDAERMRITSGGNVGIGTTSPSEMLHIKNAANNFSFIRFEETSGGGVYIGSRAQNLELYTGGSEQMRITSGGFVGIGTTSPSVLFHVKGSSLYNGVIAVDNSSTTGGGIFSIRQNGTQSGFISPLGSVLGSTARDLAYFAEAGLGHVFFTNDGNERMRITSGGDVGIGITSPEGKLTVQGTSAQPPTSGTTANSLLQLKGSLGNELNIGCNTAAGDYGSYIQSSDNNLAVPYSLNLQPNGGNVGIGTTTVPAKLSIVLDGSGNSNSSTTGSQLLLGRTNGFGEALAFRNTGSTNGISGTSYAGQIISAGNNVFEIYTDTTNPIVFGTNVTERMRITSGGSVGIGTTSPSAKLDVRTGVAGTIVNFTDGVAQTFQVGTTASGIDISNPNSGYISFSNTTERMRITSGGDVLVGCTSVPGAGGSVQGISLISSGAITALRAGATVGYFGRTNAGELFAFFNNTAQVGNISIGTSSTSYNTSSDYRLKQDLKPINGLDLVSQIKVYDYEWKSDESRAYGVLAHELQEVIPQAVNGEKDGENMQGVDYSKLVPILVQAIQELKQEIEILKNK